MSKLISHNTHYDLTDESMNNNPTLQMAI